MRRSSVEKSARLDDSIDERNVISSELYTIVKLVIEILNMDEVLR